MRDAISKYIQNVLEKLGYSIEKSTLVELSNDIKRCDFSSSIPLQLSKIYNKNPLQIANEIAELLTIPNVQITTASPGYINFSLEPEALITQVQIKVEDKKILVEYGQPNTHKLPHIGHLFSFIYGETIARLLEISGNTVLRLDYQGDIGLHVAKCLWEVKNNIDTYKSVMMTKDYYKIMEFLQTCYQDGSYAYDEDSTAQSAIKQINKSLNENSDSELILLWQDTRNACIEFYKVFEHELGINYTKHYFESENVLLAKEIIKNSDLFEKSDGAMIFKGENYGLHTRVFINNLDVPTYEGKDIGLIKRKKSDYYPFEESYVLTANEQNEYSKVVIKVSELLYPELNNKLKHIGYGMINLKSGKMSSRSGHIITATDLIEEVSTAIMQKFAMQHNKAKSLALSSIKYSFLKSNALSNIQFDINTSISKDGDSAMYLLYTLVRIYSILKKETKRDVIDVTKLQTEDINLLKKIYQYQYILERSRFSKAPHILCNYLYALCKEFSNFYEHIQILNSENDIKYIRLSILEKLKNILEEGLYILGISPVDEL